MNEVSNELKQIIQKLRENYQKEINRLDNKIKPNLMNYLKMKTQL